MIFIKEASFKLKIAQNYSKLGFSGCSNLTSTTMLPPTPPTVGDYMFAETKLATVYVTDEEAKALYEAKDPWNKYEIVALSTGIEDTKMGEDAASITDRYDLNGRRITGKQDRPVIMRYSDGSTRKVMVK